MKDKRLKNLMAMGLHTNVVSKGVSGVMGELFLGHHKDGFIEDLTVDSDGQWYRIRPNPGDWQGRYLPIVPR